MDVERIKFERTGGFTGIPITLDIKFDDLTDEQARTLSDLLDDLDFDELPENMTPESPMPDDFNYSITVETEKGKHTVTTSESSAPEKMQELLQLLNRLARSQMRKQ